MPKASSYAQLCDAPQASSAGSLNYLLMTILTHGISRKGECTMKVGFIGLGIMGRPMAKNLLKAGVDLLVADINKEAVADVVAAGAKEATYAEIGEQCQRIILMVPSGEISKSILFDEGGVASTVKVGTVVCDMSSVTPVESQEC